jgi:hypothetical protein
MAVLLTSHPLLQIMLFLFVKGYVLALEWGDLGKAFWGSGWDWEAGLYLYIFLSINLSLLLFLRRLFTLTFLTFLFLLFWWLASNLFLIRGFQFCLLELVVVVFVGFFGGFIFWVWFGVRVRFLFLFGDGVFLGLLVFLLFDAHLILAIFFFQFSALNEGWVSF